MLIRFFFGMVFAVVALSAQVFGGRGGSMQVSQRGAGTQAPPATDCAASGTVVNALTGQPIPKAMVSMGGGGDGPGSATDLQGRWSIVNTACGTFLPQAMRDGFISPFLTAPSAASQTRLQLVSGTPATNVKISLIPGGAIAGTVRDSDGEPVEGAQVRLMRANVQQGKRVMNTQNGVGSDAEGNFRIGSLIPGHYVVCADSPRTVYPVGGGAAMVYREACFPGPVASGVFNSMQVDAGREVRIALTLIPTRGVHVRGSISGAPAPPPDARPGQMVANVQLMRLQNGVGNRGGGVSRDGTFEINAVQPGTYMLRATFMGGQQQGPAPAAQTQIEVGDADIDNVVLAFQAPGTLNGNVRFELSPTGPAAAAANPTVNVNLQTATPGTPMFGPIPQAQWDAAHVGFVFAGVPSGQFHLNANLNSPTAYVKSATLRGQDVLNQGFSVDGTAGPVEIVVSDDTGSVDATVNDADGQPVAASVILISPTGQRRILRSGNDGHVSAKNVATGEYKVWAFDDINAVPYAEEDWMARNAGSGEKITVTTGGTASVALKRIAAPPQ